MATPIYANLTQPGRKTHGQNNTDRGYLLFDFKSQKWQELVKMAIGCPSWSWDSKYVYFNDLNNTGFYRVRVSDRRVEQVASLAGINVETVWTGLAPDDSPMIVLDTSIDEIYAVDWTAP